MEKGEMWKFSPSWQWQSFLSSGIKEMEKVNNFVRGWKIVAIFLMRTRTFPCLIPILIKSRDGGKED
jgi:hypothetical protein